MNNQSCVPAQLIVGNKEQVSDHVQLVLQEHFCKQVAQGNAPTLGCFCSECKKIKQRQHATIVWISPEKDYTVDDIAIIFDRIRFSLDAGALFFFVLDNADTLTTTTANRLLKVLEEPPTGYFFLLLTSNSQAILPTIASRCLIVEKGDATASQDVWSSTQHPLLIYFFQEDKRRDPFGFEQEIKKQQLSESKTIQLLESLLATFTEHMRKAMLDGDADRQQLLKGRMAHTLKALKKPPQPGSNDLFWKHFFLTFPTEINRGN